VKLEWWPRLHPVSRLITPKCASARYWIGRGARLASVRNFQGKLPGKT
jgi:hypothetical protein